jgi:ubiquinone/menaquinone biosynthesis C-methylase UbiE
MDPETIFFKGLLRLQYGQDVVNELKDISKSISWAKNWPENDKSFWNAEAFMWSKKIDKDKKNLIEKELDFLSNGNNLDLGSGAYSYINSVCFDFSEKMLQFNDNCTEKVIGNLEKKLFFKNGTFDSITAIFVLNYVRNYLLLLGEIFKIIKNKSYFVMVLSAKGVNEWQSQKEVNFFTREKWKQILESVGFKVDDYEKKDLLFFKCLKDF